MPRVGRQLAWIPCKCKVCDLKFYSARGHAGLCSAKCRKYWSKHHAPYPLVAKLRAQRDEDEQLAKYNQDTPPIPGLVDPIDRCELLPPKDEVSNDERLRVGNSNAHKVSVQPSADVVIPSGNHVVPGQTNNRPQPGAVRQRKLKKPTTTKRKKRK